MSASARMTAIEDELGGTHVSPARRRELQAEAAKLYAEENPEEEHIDLEALWHKDGLAACLAVTEPC